MPKSDKEQYVNRMDKDDKLAMPSSTATAAMPAAKNALMGTGLGALTEQEASTMTKAVRHLQK